MLALMNVSCHQNVYSSNPCGYGHIPVVTNRFIKGLVVYKTSMFACTCSNITP